MFAIFAKITVKKQILFLKILSYGSLAIGGLIAVFSITVGAGTNPSYFWGLLIAVPLFVLSIFAHSRQKQIKLLLTLRGKWGKGNRKARDYQQIATLYNYSDKTASTIDQQTWDDFSMNDVYAKIDATMTTPGEEVLYAILREPCFGKDELTERNRIISLFQDNAIIREKVQILLYDLGCQKANGLTHLLWGELPPKHPFSLLFTLLTAAAWLALAGVLIWGARGMFLIFGVFSLNSYVHYRVSKKYLFEMPSITYLKALLKTAKKMTKMGVRELEDYQISLHDAVRASQKIISKTKYLYTNMKVSDVDIIYDYLKIYFLLEIRCFYAALNEIEKQRHHLRSIYRIIGTLDSLQAVASYRESLSGYTEPQFVTVKNYLRIDNLKHPLLKNPVPNTVKLAEQGILITGSNMSGKSTFLRSIGINVLLAQTIYTCSASSYTGCQFHIVSSINKSDDLSQGKSFYYAEAERLLKIIQSSNMNKPVLCLIDELLSGTNYLERISASTAILHYLRKKEALVIVATHDLDIAGRLKGAYQLYHFTDKADEKGMDFDYILKEGIATTRNAIKLLKHIGYPAEIIEEASVT